MSDLVKDSDAGIVSLAGYAYQIKVFIMLLTSLKKGQRIGFETLDDVAIENIDTSDKQTDFCVKTQTDDIEGTTVFQVKQTVVSASVSEKILYNWLIALTLHPEIANFKLYFAEGYTVDDEIFRDSPPKIYNKIVTSEQRANALISKAKKIYKDNFPAFEHDYKHICEHYRSVSIKNIDHEIVQRLNTTLHLEASNISSVYAQRRVDELFTRVCGQIMSSIALRIPYTTIVEEYLQCCEGICHDIGPGRYAPDYSAFEQLHTKSYLDKEIQESREYKQLEYCKLSLPKIKKHLIWEQYYKNLRSFYMRDALPNRINAIEDIAYENYGMVVEDLKDENIDTPSRRLRKTKEQGISYLTEEHSRWGAYVYLTGDDIPNRISWKDDEDGGE